MLAVRCGMTWIFCTNAPSTPISVFAVRQYFTTQAAAEARALLCDYRCDGVVAIAKKNNETVKLKSKQSMELRASELLGDYHSVRLLLTTCRRARGEKKNEAEGERGEKR